jgi:undecaprenol kinase
MITNRVVQFANVTAAPAGETAAPGAFRRPIRARLVRNALKCAVRGLQDAWRSQPNVRLHGYFGLGVMLLGAICRLSLSGWLWVVFAIGLVLFAELMNTAIESTVDLVIGLRPDPLARQIKDVAAGCVLVATILAVMIETLVFIPHLLRG